MEETLLNDLSDASRAAARRSIPKMTALPGAPSTIRSTAAPEEEGWFCPSGSVEFVQAGQFSKIKAVKATGRRVAAKRLARKLFLILIRESFHCFDMSDISFFIRFMITFSSFCGQNCYACPISVSQKNKTAYYYYYYYYLFIIYFQRLF